MSDLHRNFYCDWNVTGAKLNVPFACFRGTALARSASWIIPLVGACAYRCFHGTSGSPPPLSRSVSPPVSRGRAFPSVRRTVPSGASDFHTVGWRFLQNKIMNIYTSCDGIPTADRRLWILEINKKGPVSGLMSLIYGRAVGTPTSKTNPQKPKTKKNNNPKNNQKTPHNKPPNKTPPTLLTYSNGSTSNSNNEITH